MNNHKLPDVPAISLFFAMVILALVMVFMPGATTNTNLSERHGLKRLYLTLNGYEIDHIKEMPRGTEFTGNSGKLIVDDISLELPDITLKGRGNSTWNQPKGPLTMKTSNKYDFLDGGESRKWTLLANYFDDSNIRNAVALHIARLLGMPYTAAGDFVELYADDEYRGLYYMTDKVEVGKGRVDLREPDGVLVERRTNTREETDVCYGVYENLCFVVKDLVAKDNEEAAMTDFVDGFSKFDAALDTGDYEKVKKTIDTHSFAQYYLISEITVDPDAYLTSQYFYKDGVSDVIHAGPAWDYDFAMNNARWIWTDDEEYFAPTELGKNMPEDSFFARLLEYDEFKAEVRELYNGAIKTKHDEILSFARHEAARISLPAMINNLRWDRFDFDSEVKSLLEWLETRLNYLDGVFSEVVE